MTPDQSSSVLPPPIVPNKKPSHRDYSRQLGCPKADRKQPRSPIRRVALLLNWGIWLHASKKIPACGGRQMRYYTRMATMSSLHIVVRRAQSSRFSPIQKALATVSISPGWLSTVMPSIFLSLSTFSRSICLVVMVICSPLGPSVSWLPGFWSTG